MPKLIKQLLAGMSFYALAGMVDAGMGFLLVPLYTYHFHPSVFGELQLLNTYIAFTSMLCGLGMSNAYLRAFHQTEDKQKRTNHLLLAIRLQWMALFALFIALAIIQSLFDLRLYLGSFLDLRLGLLWASVVCSGLLVAMAFAHLRAHEQAARFLGMGSLGAVCSLIANLILVVALGMKTEGVLLANVFSNLVLSVVIFKPYRHVLFKPIENSRVHIKSLLHFGLPLVPAAAALWVIDLSDRYLLQLYADTSVLAVYSLAYKYASIMLIVITVMHTAWVPMLLRIHRQSSKQETHRFFAQSAMLGLLALALFAALLYLMRSWVIDLIAPNSYAEASQFIAPLLIGFMFYAAYYLATGMVFLTGKSTSLLYGSFIACIINLICNLIWIPEYHAIGAAWATAAAYASLCIATILKLVYDARNSFIKET